MVTSGRCEHVRTEREAKTGLQYNNRITMDKKKRERRNVRSWPLSQCLDYIMSPFLYQITEIVKLQSGPLPCFRGRPGFRKQAFVHGIKNRPVFGGYLWKFTASRGTALSLA